MGCSLNYLWLLATIIMEIIDLIVDWVFFSEIYKYEGRQLEDVDSVEWAILTFAIIGTILFIIQITTLWHEINGKKESYTKTTVVTFISTCIEDLPQMILAIIVAVKTSEEISVVQKVKSFYGIVEAFIHVVVCITTLCRGRYKSKGNGDCLKGLIVGYVVTGLFILTSSGFLTFELYKDKFHNFAQNATT